MSRSTADKIAWLLGRKASPAQVTKPKSDYAKVREELGFSAEDMQDAEVARVVKRAYYNQRARQQYQQARSIGDLPEVQQPGRRAECEHSLQKFIEAYFRGPGKFDLPWASFHIEVISKLEESILHGGLFAMALPRGSGKTSIVERAIIWSLLYGHRHYVVALGDGKAAATEILECVQTEIESNDRLMEDFPEVCHPIRLLGGIPQRAAGQYYHGKPTCISWGSTGEIVLPTIDGSVSSGAILVVAGINSRLRGMKHTTSDGHEYRPDFVFLDDPQNDRSAASPSQNDKRLKVLRGAVLGLAGAGKKLSGVMACTVIRSGDMADVVLDNEQSPEWRGVRYALMPSMPTDKEHWEKYRELWADGQRTGRGIKAATDYYLAHQEEMDEGAEASWAARYEQDEASAVQYAMDRMYQSGEAFWAEYQNSPTNDDEDADRIIVKPADVLRKVSGIPRLVVPADAVHLVASVDVQKGVLPYVVAAFTGRGTCHVIDYGTWPKQPSPDWSLGNLAASYVSEGMGLEASLRQALDDLTTEILGKAYAGEDGSEHHIERCLIDAAWGVSTSTVLSFCSRSQYAAILTPSFGRGLGPDKRPYSEYRREAGKRIGDFWLLSKHKSGVKVIEIDTNFCKSLLRQRILTPMGDKASWEVWGKQHDSRTSLYHTNFARQMSSEFAISTSGRQRTVEVWSLRPGQDNHYWDCCSNCYAAASMCGMTLADLTGVEAAKKAKKSYKLPQKS